MSHEQYSGIIEGLRDVAGKFGDKAAVGGIDRSYSTHTQLIEQIDQTAEKLRSAQIKSGDLVIVALDEGPEFLTAILSVMSAAIPLPLNPSIPAQEAEYFFAELPIAAIIVTERAGSALVMAAEASGVSILRLVTDQQRPAGQFDLLLTRYTRPPEQQIDNPMQTALLSTSSGTTGTPKIIAHTHASMVTNCISFADQARLTNEDKSLCVVPFALLHSLWRSCLPVLLRGGQVVCASGFDARRALDQIDDVRPTFMTAVPSIYLLLLKRIAETGWSPDGCSIRALFCGSDA
ncbi:AMP-binding protein, partial [Pacificibacter sp.]|uniref:AMP-binding protein n=1 Tax=Pacificibacter sp. TaxID=1917866 RepID=UPI00321AA174